MTTSKTAHSHMDVLRAGEQCLERLRLYRRSHKKLHLQYNDMKMERDRLLVLATKHCPKNHHDWDEILKIAGDA